MAENDYTKVELRQGGHVVNIEAGHIFPFRDDVSMTTCEAKALRDALDEVLDD